MESKSGKIGGWTIENNGLTNGKVFIREDGYATVYTVADIIILRGYLAGKDGFTDLSDKMIRHYDINGDGVVNITDLIQLRKLLEMD